MFLWGMAGVYQVYHLISTDQKISDRLDETSISGRAKMVTKPLVWFGDVGLSMCGSILGLLSYL